MDITPITPIFEAIISLAVAVIGVLATFAIRWLRRKLSDNQLETLAIIVETAVKAVEQLKNAGVIRPDERKREALEQIQKVLAAKKITFDLDVIDNAIEAAVLQLNIEQAIAGYKKDEKEEETP